MEIYSQNTTVLLVHLIVQRVARKNGCHLMETGDAAHIQMPFVALMVIRAAQKAQHVMILEVRTGQS